MELVNAAAFQLLNYQITNSVHPSALTAAVLLVFVIGRAEVAIFVKIIRGVLVVLAHVDLELPSCPAALPAMIAIADSEKGFRQREQESPAGRDLNVDVAKEQPAQMGHVGRVSFVP